MVPRIVLPFALLLTIPIAAGAQPTEPLDVKAKLNFHAKNNFAPMSLAGLAAYAAILQEANAPEEWKQGGAAYGKRFGTMVAWSGIHGALAFGLDSTLHQDPRYFRSGETGFWRRSGHAFRGIILTRTDRGGETLSSWRFGADYGSAFLSNMWYPSRLNTVRLNARLRSGRQSGLGVLAGHQKKGAAPEMRRNHDCTSSCPIAPILRTCGISLFGAYTRSDYRFHMG